MNPQSYAQLKVVEVEFAVFVPFDVKDSFGDPTHNYQVLGSKGEGYLNFKRDYTPVPQHFPLAIAHGAKVSVDRYGQLSRSVVRVELPKKTLEAFGMNEAVFSDPAQRGRWEDTSLDYALELLNKFSTKYAEVTGDFWVSIPTKNEILSHKIRPVFNLAIGGYTTKMLPVPTHFSGGKGHFISEELDANLRQKLIAKESNTVTELILSAQDFTSREQYKLSIVQCAIAFEYFVYNELLSFPSKRKKKTFMDNHTKNVDCGCHIGINAFCKSGLSEYLGVDFSATDEFTKVTGGVTSIRNKIVHGEPVEVTEEQAVRAIQATKDAINLLRELSAQRAK